MDLETPSHKCGYCGKISPEDEMAHYRGYNYNYWVCWECRKKADTLVENRHNDFLLSYKGRKLRQRNI